jgi:hypothetical protein
MRGLVQLIFDFQIGLATIMRNQDEVLRLSVEKQKFTDAVNHKTALEHNTQAVERNTQTIREGMFGGGERARGAIPNAWKGSNSSMWGSQIARLGAFAM